MGACRACGRVLLAAPRVEAGRKKRMIAPVAEFTDCLPFNPAMLSSVRKCARGDSKLTEANFQLRHE